MRLNRELSPSKRLGMVSAGLTVLAALSALIIWQQVSSDVPRLSAEESVEHACDLLLKGDFNYDTTLIWTYSDGTVYTVGREVSGDDFWAGVLEMSPEGDFAGKAEFIQKDSVLYARGSTNYLDSEGSPNQYTAWQIDEIESSFNPLLPCYFVGNESEGGASAWAETTGDDETAERQFTWTNPDVDSIHDVAKRETWVNKQGFPVRVLTTYGSEETLGAWALSGEGEGEGSQPELYLVSLEERHSGFGETNLIPVPMATPTPTPIVIPTPTPTPTNPYIFFKEDPDYSPVAGTNDPFTVFAGNLGSGDGYEVKITLRYWDDDLTPVVAQHDAIGFNSECSSTSTSYSPGAATFEQQMMLYFCLPGYYVVRAALLKDGAEVASDKSGVVVYDPASPDALPPVVRPLVFLPTAAEHRSGMLGYFGCGVEAWECVDESSADGNATIVTLLFGGAVRFGFTVHDGDVPGEVTAVRFEVAVAANSVEIAPEAYRFVVYAGDDAVATVPGKQALDTDYREVVVSSAAITDALSSSPGDAAIQVEGPTGTFLRVTWVRMVVEYTPTTGS